MRKRLTAIVLAVLVFSLIAASAATLGGITSAGVGADTTVVAACDSDGVDVDYTYSYSVALNGYEIDTVDVSDIADACYDSGYQISLTISNGGNSTVIPFGPSAITDNGPGDNDSASFAVADGAMSANALARVSIVIG